VCLLYRLAEGTGSCIVAQINVGPKGNWYRLVQKKVDQQIVRGSEY
jgi:hypothetical protein